MSRSSLSSRSVSPRSILWTLALVGCGVAAGCGGSDGEDLFGDSTAGGVGGAGASGAAGTSAGAGGGTGGTSAGGAGTGGTAAGAAGSAGAGKGGSAGATGGGSGNGGAGAGGKGGTGGAGGAGNGGAGAAGKGGSAGAPGGSGGAAGTAGKGGAAGATGGSAGATGGSAGATGGSAGATGGSAGATGGSAGATGGSAGATGGSAGAAGASDKCPGTPVDVGGSAVVTVSGSTVGATADYQSGSNMCGGQASSEVVYAVTVQATGQLKLTSTTTYSGSLYVRSVCGDEGSRIGCDASFNGPDVVTVPVKSGQTYYVFVDGASTNGQNQAGGFTLSMEIAVCGDKIVDAGEECDDGNDVPGDGCDGLCKFEDKCAVNSQEPNPEATPQKLPGECLTANVGQGSIADNGQDEDWYCIEAKEGETIEAGTWVTSPTASTGCPVADTVVEIYAKGAPAPSNSSCSNSSALACDDDGGPGSCSLASYQVPAGAGGEYCIRVIDKNKNSGIPFYQLYVLRR